MSKIDLVLQGRCDNLTYEIAESYITLPFVNNVIISCWENDPDRTTNDRILIVKSKDIMNPGDVNRNRQIKTSLVGLNEVRTEFSAKLRSDQIISLDSMNMMFDFYERHKKQTLSFSDGTRPNNKICVAGIFRNFPFHPRDHIFWGNTKDLIDVFNIPFDDTSLNSDYTKYVRAEAYIAMHYYARFDQAVARMVKEPSKYLVDNAPLINEAFVKSNELGSLVFKPFPRIDFEWPKHGLKRYHYDYTSSVLGEYWSSNDE